MRNLRQFSALPRGCDIARYNMSNDCRQVRAFLYIYSFQSCYPVVTELNQVVSNNVALFIQYFRQTHRKTTLDWQVYLFR